MIIPITTDPKKYISQIEIDQLLRRVTIFYTDGRSERREFKPEEWKDSILKIVPMKASHLS